MATEKLFAQYGCGPNAAPDGWLNFDSSPTLRLQRLPVLGGIFQRVAKKQPFMFPPSVRYGDIVRGLPLPDNSVDGLYSSHILEHLPMTSMRQALRNSYRVLKPGGIFRVLVPDLLERARRYVAAAEQGDVEAAPRFMRDTTLGREHGPEGLVGWLRQSVSNSPHVWMWDRVSTVAELERAGFTDIRDAAMGDSGEPMFDRVEDIGRFIDDGFPAVALQATKPRVN